MSGIQSIKVGITQVNSDVEFTGAVVQIDEQTVDFGVSNKTLIIESGDDIQTALDELNAVGGGSLYLKAGTYTTTALTGYSNIHIFGDNQSNTIIDFNNTSANLSFIGSNIYTTGTITSISGGVNVTGSGTSWLANASAGQQLFIGTRWYLIAAVTSDTTLILAEGYGDNIALPSTYRIATPVTGIRMTELMFKNSTGTGLSLTDCRDIEFKNILFLTNNVGFGLTNVSQCVLDALVCVANTSDGYQMTNCGLFNVNAVDSQSNGGNGATLNNLKTVPFVFSACDNNAGDGYHCTNCTSMVLQVEASGNGGQGVEFVSNCNSNFITISLFSGNVSDGLKLTATSDGNTIGPDISFSGNGGYGINIAATTSDNNIIIAPYYVSNTSGSLSDLGTGTMVISAKGTGTIASSATPTINTDMIGTFSVTALAADITSFTTNLSGMPNNFDKLIMRIKDDGTARAITWGASFEAKGVALPTTTVISKVLTVGFIYDAVTSKWGCVASAQEA